MMQMHYSQLSDATARTRTEEEVREAARFRALFEATTAGVVEVAPDARVLGANDAFCRMTGYAPTELGAMTVSDLLFPEDRARVWARDGEVAAGRAAPYEEERRYRRKDGSALWARVSVVAPDERRPTPVFVVVTDLTERKHLEEQLWQAQKIETAGLLASCLAHDFNNLLTAISGCAQILAEELPQTGPTRELVRDMTAACRRAAGLTAQLRAFGRKAPAEPRVLDLNEVVAQSARLLRPLLGEGITLVTDLAGDLNGVRADPAQVEQVILNLAVNAKDAMSHGGTLTIETRALRLREGSGTAPPESLPGEYVLLSVSDTGVGMTDEVKARAFEPFFTTKEVGKGTGLGLAAVLGTVTRCGGRVSVASEPGVGTTITVLFPAAAVRPVS